MITLRVNGQDHQVDAEPDMPLLWVIRDLLGLTGTKYGCGEALCGACTVHLDGVPVRSCVTPVQTMNGAEITTLEGLGTIEKPHPIQKAFIDEQAMQCGFCLSGVMLTAKVALDRNPRATDAQLQQALSNVLCRCGAHTRMMKAIKRYQKEGARA